MATPDLAEYRQALVRDRDTTAAQLDRLRRDLDEIFRAAADVAVDDEHDPEGATIAYERSRTGALIAQAEAHLDEIALALRRVDAGTYGVCLECGSPIGSARLLARPAARTCVACSSR
ncbi:MAG TPA: TraR/DksA C4-type zinc finger protein [Mycobacteriales bacterium]|nr:TraR/DksA C4-type zinc finger protein [Mycobacteriales bacterium]